MIPNDKKCTFILISNPNNATNIPDIAGSGRNRRASKYLLIRLLTSGINPMANPTGIERRIASRYPKRFSLIENHEFHSKFDWNRSPNDVMTASGDGSMDFDMLPYVVIKYQMVNKRANPTMDMIALFLEVVSPSI